MIFNQKYLHGNSNSTSTDDMVENSRSKLNRISKSLTKYYLTIRIFFRIHLHLASNAYIFSIGFHIW